MHQSGCGEFDASATIDDGSCEPIETLAIAEEPMGCTVSGATNYDASATIDDGSCEEQAEADCNYNDSCVEYIEPSPLEPTDMADASTEPQDEPSDFPSLGELIYSDATTPDPVGNLLPQDEYEELERAFEDACSDGTASIECIDAYRKLKAVWERSTGKGTSLIARKVDGEWQYFPKTWNGETNSPSPGERAITGFATSIAYNVTPLDEYESIALGIRPEFDLTDGIVYQPVSGEQRIIDGVMIPATIAMDYFGGKLIAIGGKKFVKVGRYAKGKWQRLVDAADDVNGYKPPALGDVLVDRSRSFADEATDAIGAAYKDNPAACFIATEEGAGAIRLFTPNGPNSCAEDVLREAIKNGFNPIQISPPIQVSTQKRALKDFFGDDFNFQYPGKVILKKPICPRCIERGNDDFLKPLIDKIDWDDF